jgi:dolichol-phosphate mannosyltransferase
LPSAEAGRRELLGPSFGTSLEQQGDDGRHQAAPGDELRHSDTSLFPGSRELYKARAVQGFFKRPTGPLPGRQTLFHDGIERNLSMDVALSVVVPVKDEAENVAPLAREIAAALAGEASSEIIFVDDGSSDGTAQALMALKPELPTLRVVQHGRNIGQSRGIRTGVRAARGALIVTLDGDGQNDPADIPKLLEIFRSEAEPGRIGLVSGVRARREDTISRRYASRIANAIRRGLLKDGAADTGCGLKVFRRDVFLALPYFDNVHRYLITLVIREGYEARFVAVNHRARVHGRSKYTNFGRMLVGISDLMGVRWLQSRFKGPVETKEV